jgi:hypothetical protein
MGQGGIISLSPGLVDYNIVLLTGDELIKNRAKDKVTSIIRAIVHADTACAVFDRLNERYLLAYGDDATDPRNNKVLVLDWSQQSFTRIIGWQVNNFLMRANGELLIATNNYILRANQNRHADWDPATGNYKAIRFNPKFKQWNFDYPFHIKKSKKLLLAAKQYDTDISSIDKLNVTGDYTTKTFSDISLDESFVWGESWGNVWGYADLTTKELKCKLKALRYQVEIDHNTIDEPVTIYGFGFEFKLKRPEGVKVDG